MIIQMLSLLCITSILYNTQAKNYIFGFILLLSNSLCTEFTNCWISGLKITVFLQDGYNSCTIHAFHTCIVLYFIISILWQVLHSWIIKDLWNVNKFYSILIIYKFLRSPRWKSEYHRMYKVRTHSNFFYKYVYLYSMLLTNSKHVMNWKMINYQVCWYATTVSCYAYCHNSWKYTAWIHVYRVPKTVIDIWYI